MLTAIHSFVDTIRKGDVEVYNEISLQHELGKINGQANGAARSLILMHDVVTHYAGTRMFS